MSTVVIVAVSAVVSTLGLYAYRLYRRGQSSEEEDTEPHGATETVSSSSHGRDSDESTTASRLSVSSETESQASSPRTISQREPPPVAPKPKQTPPPTAPKPKGRPTPAASTPPSSKSSSSSSFTSSPFIPPRPGFWSGAGHDQQQGEKEVSVSLEEVPISFEEPTKVPGLKSPQRHKGPKRRPPSRHHDGQITKTEQQ